MHHRTLCFIAIALLTAAGGAGRSSYAAPMSVSSDELAASLQNPSCFCLRNLFNGTVLNDSELIVYAPLDLVQLFEPVSDLSSQQNLLFEDVENTEQICNDSGAHLSVGDETRSHKPIVAVRRRTMTQQAALLKAAREHLASGERCSHPGT